ncbi:MAG: hypothetical protein Q4D73_06630 [Actinomycetaceae bacterium]|nr:hypothetical protein [Actinomycetaceae bacterium]
MKDDDPYAVITTKAEHFWIYCITLDGKRPEDSTQIEECPTYEYGKKLVTPTSKTWIRSVKIHASNWETIPPGLDLDLPDMSEGIPIKDPEMFIDREIQYYYIIVTGGYEIEEAPLECLFTCFNYQEASRVVSRSKTHGTIYIRQITIDYEPWLEIHPTDHPNPPEAPPNLALL